MMRNIDCRSWPFGFRPALNIFRNSQVSDGAARHCHFDCFVQDIVKMGRTHYPFVVRGDIHKELVQRHILMEVRTTEIVESMTGYSENRLPVEFRIVQAVEQMYAARPRCRYTNA